MPGRLGRTAPLFVVALLALVTLTACALPTPTPAPAPTATPAPPPTATPAATHTPIPVPTATPEPTPTPAPKTVHIPVELAAVHGIGSLHVELVYDPAALTALSVSAGPLAANALFEADVATPGRVVIGIVDATGITGSGPVATITFEPAGPRASSALELEDVQAFDAETMVDLLLSAEPGRFNAADGTTLAPTLREAD